MADEDAPPTGVLRWFSSDEGPDGWRLDVVTLLAVIGESSIADHAQTITASMMCLLPRIIPAPQALLKPSRPQRLPEVQAKMTGVYSGVHFDSVGFFANILHPLDEMKRFSFKVLRITHTDILALPSTPATQLTQLVDDATRSGLLAKLWPFGRKKRGASRSGPLLPSDLGESGAPARISTGSDAPAPRQGIRRRDTKKDKMQDFMANPYSNSDERPAIPPSLYSPTHILSLFSLFVTVGIIIAAVFWQDGTAIIAVSLISLASSVVGLASWWRPLLTKRTHKTKVPDGDVLIRTREGGFLIIKCSEEVARELYAGTEECDYRIGDRIYQALMGVGTLLLMVSVILLGNCKWLSQIFIGAAYIVLNALYWCMSLLPKRYFWDLSRYHVEDITPEDARKAHEDDPSESRKAAADKDPERVQSFTRTLWYAVRETRRTSWVEKNGAAPNTPQWRQWLEEAEQEANRIEEDRLAGRPYVPWGAVARKNDIMSGNAKPVVGLGDRDGRPSVDAAQNNVPDTEVQPFSHS